jgi:hypothetical protein
MKTPEVDGALRLAATSPWSDAGMYSLKAGPSSSSIRSNVAAMFRVNLERTTRVSYASSFSKKSRVWSS